MLLVATWTGLHLSVWHKHPDLVCKGVWNSEKVLECVQGARARFPFNQNLCSMPVRQHILFPPLKNSTAQKQKGKARELFFLECCVGAVIFLYL